MKLLGMLVSALLLVVGTAGATLIQYDTDTYITQHPGGAPCAFGNGVDADCFKTATFFDAFGNSLTLTIQNEETNTQVNAPPATNVTYGEILAVYTPNLGGGFPGAPVVVPATWHVHVNVQEDLPSIGVNFFHLSSNGGACNASNCTLNFTGAPSMTIGTETWVVQVPVLIVAPSSQGGAVTTYQGTVDAPQDTNIPEPTTFALGGIGLVALGLIRRRVV